MKLTGCSISGESIFTMQIANRLASILIRRLCWKYEPHHAHLAKKAKKSFMYELRSLVNIKTKDTKNQWKFWIDGFFWRLFLKKLNSSLWTIFDHYNCVCGVRFNIVTYLIRKRGSFIFAFDSFVSCFIRNKINSFPFFHLTKRQKIDTYFHIHSTISKSTV